MVVPDLVRIINLEFFPQLQQLGTSRIEEFPEELHQIDLLKLRVSYGQIGNQAIDPIKTQALLGNNLVLIITAAFGYPPKFNREIQLRWKFLATFNTGVTSLIWQGRVLGCFGYYITITSDLLALRPYLMSTGFGGFITNYWEGPK